jgi:hypothetical protein
VCICVIADPLTGASRNGLHLGRHVNPESTI